MSNELKIFENAEFGSVRTMLIDNEPWFVGKDICGYFNDKNHNRTLQRVDDADKRSIEIKDSLGRNQKALFVNESGLYSILFSLQPQKANNGGVPNAYPIETQERIEKIKRFKRWVTHEVLPSIRKHGAYATSDTIDKIIADPEYGIKLLQALKDERDKTRVLTDKVKAQSRQIEVMKPKATYYDIVLSCKDAVAISQISKDYGMSAQQMNQMLYKHGVQYKRGKTWLLYQKHADKGYTKTQTRMYTGKDGIVHPYIHTCWTQKGRMFIYELMRNEGILPMVEREDDVYAV